ncbi:hypothetical protein DPEC_G00226530, partial [Dallia pectoralis]
STTITWGDRTLSLTASVSSKWTMTTIIQSVPSPKHPHPLRHGLLKAPGGIWHQDISRRSFKSCGLQCG